MGLGLENAFGFQQGMEALHTLIAERKKDELLKQREVEQQRQFELQEARMREEAGWRQMQIEDRRAESEANEKFRRDQLAATENSRKAVEARALRDDVRDQYQEAGAGQVSAEEYARAIANGVPRSSFAPDKIASLDVQGTEPAAPQTFQYSGGEKWKQRQADLAYRKAHDDEVLDTRKALAAAAGNRPQVTVVPIWNPQTATTDLTAINKRGLAPGQVVGQQAPNAALQGQAMAAEGGLAQLSKIQSLYKPEYVGPAQGRLNEWVGLGTGYTADKSGVKRISPEFAEFANAVVTNKNRMIKLITGAAMNKEEVPRIVGQVPDFSQPPEVFKANLDGGIALERELMQRIRNRKAQGLSTPGVDIDANGNLIETGDAGAPAAGAPPSGGADPFGALKSLGLVP